MFSLERNKTKSEFIPYFHTILKAFNDINNKTDGIFDDILPNTQLKIIHRSANNQFLRGAIKVGELLSVDPTSIPIANVGPIDLPTIRGASPAFQEAAKISVFNYRDRTALFGRSDLYPNMMRVLPATYIDGYVIAILISQYFGWEKVTMFYQSSDSAIFAARVFRYYADIYGIDILSSHPLDIGDEDYSEAINGAKKVGSRIFILFLDPAVGVKLIKQGHDLKLFNGNTQIIGGEEMSTSSSWTPLNLSPETLNSLLTGFIGVAYQPYAPPSEMKTKFLNDWVNQKSTEGYINNQGVSVCNTRMDSYNSSYLYQYYPALDTSKPLKCAGLDYSAYKNHPNLQTELDPMMYGYDAVLSIAIGLHQLIYNFNNTKPTPSDLHSIVLSENFSFTGLTGKVSYSSLMVKDQLDVGGRMAGLRYNIVNYVPIENSSISSNVIFKTVITWSSDTGFPECHNHIHHDSNDKPPCPSFQFQTKKNTFPSDSPPPVFQYMFRSYQIVLISLAIIGMTGILLIGFVLHLYRNRRLVKMNQPILSSMMLLGMIFGLIRVVMAGFDPTSNLCRTRLWLEHLAFQLIFGTLMVRSLRVYLVTCTMKRTKITESQCVIIVLLSMIITVTFLIAAISVDNKNAGVIIVTKNQFEYIVQYSCDYDARNIILVIYIYELFVLFVGLILCWLIRKVQSTVSNTSILLEVLLTTTTISIGMYIILKIIKLDSNTRSFVVGFTISVTLLRLLWVFYSQLIFNLFSGYELDRSLGLRKSEKNILQLMGCGKLSHQIFATNDDDIPASSLGNKVNGETVVSSSNIDDKAMMKYLEKFKKLKNRDALNHEINRIKEEMQRKQMELGCLENMMFAGNQENSNSNSNMDSSKGSRHESGLQSNYNRYSVEGQSVNEGEYRDEYNENIVNLEKNYLSTVPSRMNSDYPGDTSGSVKSPVSTIV